jgi:hypothetical protein
MRHPAGRPCSLDLLSEANVVPGPKFFVILMT